MKACLKSDLGFTTPRQLPDTGAAEPRSESMAEVPSVWKVPKLGRGWFQVAGALLELGRTAEA